MDIMSKQDVLLVKPRVTKLRAIFFERIDCGANRDNAKAKIRLSAFLLGCKRNGAF